MRAKLLLLPVCLAFGLLTSMPSTVSANDDVISKVSNPKNWAIQTGDYANHRYSKLDQIKSSNVKDLEVAWSFSTGVLRGHEGAPLVIGNTMFVHTPFPNNIYALDLANDGAIKWVYEPKQSPDTISVMCCDTVNRGLAYANGRLFLHQADATLVALDERTGRVLWSVKNGNPAKGETNSATILPVKDKIIVGISGGDFGVRGHVSAYAIADGKLLWRGYTTGPDTDTLMDPENTTHLGEPVGTNSGMTTWPGNQWQIGGGTTSGWYSYDPDTNLMYYGTSKPSSWNPVQRPGDNRWSMSIFARDVDTGMVKWVYQMTPHNEWGYDGNNEMILSDIPIKEVTRKTLVHFDQNGFGYTLDRVTGELLVAAKYDTAVNWASHIDLETGRPQVVEKYSTEKGGEDVITKNICPAALGSKNQQPAAFSPRTSLFYVPTTHICMDFKPSRVSYVPGQPYVGAEVSIHPAIGHKHTGNFIAWNASTGRIAWSNQERFSVYSGALATAGNLVFYGTLEGYLKAVDAKTGEELYKFKTPSGIIGNVMTYEYDGKQYIGILSGIGGSAGIGLAAGLTDPHAGFGAVGGYSALRKYTRLGGQLTVFALDDETESSKKEDEDKQ